MTGRLRADARRPRAHCRILRGKAAAPSKRLTARVLIVGERIDAAGFERPDTICPLPLAFRVGEQYHGEGALGEAKRAV